MLRFFILFILLFAAGCSQSNQNEIPIGFYAPMSGSTAYFGITVRQGVELALQGLKVNGKELKLATVDDRGNPEEAQSAVTRLIMKDHVVAILGEASSSGSLAGGPICQQHGIPMLTPTATNPKVTEIGDYIFRICWIDPFQGELMAKFAINSLHARKMAILYDVGSDYSVGLVEVFTSTVEKLGGHIVEKKSFNAGDTDFSAQLTAIQSVNPDAVFLPVFYTEAGLILRQARSLQMKSDFLGSDGWDSPKLIEIGGEALNGSYFCTHFFSGDPAPLVQKFVAAYRSKFHQLPSMGSALGYDAARLLVQSLEGGIDPKQIRDRLAATKNFPGVTGEITMNPQRNAVKPAVVLQIKDGQYHFVQKISP